MSLTREEVSQKLEDLYEALTTYVDAEKESTREFVTEQLGEGACCLVPCKDTPRTNTWPAVPLSDISRQELPCEYTQGRYDDMVDASRYQGGALSGELKDAEGPEKSPPVPHVINLPPPEPTQDMTIVQSYPGLDVSVALTGALMDLSNAEFLHIVSNLTVALIRAKK